MSRSHEYTQGKRAGIKWAIAWLHERASEMNDDHAKAVLNTAAFNMGVDNRTDDQRQPKATREPHKVMTPEEYAVVPIVGWHEVCRDVDGAGGLGVRYLGE